MLPAISRWKGVSGLYFEIEDADDDLVAGSEDSGGDGLEGERCSGRLGVEDGEEGAKREPREFERHRRQPRDENRHENQRELRTATPTSASASFIAAGWGVRRDCTSRFRVSSMPASLSILAWSSGGRCLPTWLLWNRVSRA